MPGSLQPPASQTPPVQAAAPPSRAFGLRLDLLALIALVLVSAVRFKTSFDPGKIVILPSLAPSVNLACGNGFAHDAFGFDQRFGNKELKAFLDKETPCFDCSKASQFVWKATDDWTRIHYNIYYSIGLWWKMTGVCWDALPSYFLVVFLLTSLVLYMLFRQAMRPALAFVLCLPVVLSPANISWLPDIRTYLKYPLFVVFLLFLALMIRLASTRKALAFAALSGITVGIGVGFRNDLMQCVAVFFFVAIVLWAFNGRRDIIRLTKAVGVFLLFFLVCSSPYLANILSASRSPHAFILGLSETYFKELSLSDAVYSVPTSNNDTAVRRLVEAHSAYSRDSSSRLERISENEYDIAAASGFKKYATLFPADLALRFLSTVAYNLNLPFEQGALARFSWGGAAWFFPFMLLTASFAIALRNWRTGLAALGTCVGMLGVTSLYRETRHLFYLEFFAYLLTGVTAQAFWSWRRAGYAGVSLAVGLKAAALLVGAVAATLIAVAGLRAVQTERVAALIEGYGKAPSAPVAHELVRTPDGGLRLSLPPSSNPHDFRLLALTLAPPGVGGQVGIFKARLDSALPVPKQILTFDLRGPGERVLYLPLFGDLDALVLENGSEALLRAVKELPGGAPPWPFVRLGPLPDVPARPPYRTFEGLTAGGGRP